MTTGGWIIMLLSVGAVTVLFLWCIWRVLRTPGETEKLHGFEFETPDEKAARERREARQKRRN
jgi:hypothetical protein